MARPRRQLVIVLAAEQFDRLKLQADAALRDPWAHARWLLLRALDDAEVSVDDTRPLPTAVGE